MQIKTKGFSDYCCLLVPIWASAGQIETQISDTIKVQKDKVLYTGNVLVQYGNNKIEAKSTV